MVPQIDPERMHRWLRYARQPDAWTAAERSVRWRLGARFSQPGEQPPLTWRLPPDVATDTVVVWPRKASAYALGWAAPIGVGLRHHLPVRPGDVEQPPGNVFAFGILGPEGQLRVGVDFDDLSDLAADPRDFDVYFKMQFRLSGYDDPRVLPGGYVSKKPALYDFIDRWRDVRAASAKRIDVFASFGLRHGADLRSKLLEQLSAQQRFTFAGGSTRMPWWAHTQRLCESKVAIDAPGRGEFSYRLVECLALGCCVVGPELENRMPVPLVNGIHELRVRRDLAGLVETCAVLAADEEARRGLSLAAQRYFDQVLRREQLAGYYLHESLQRLRSFGEGGQAAAAADAG